MRRLLLALTLMASPAFGAFGLIAEGAATWNDPSNVILNTTGANLIIVTVTQWYTASDSGYPRDYQGAGNNSACYVSAAAAINTGHLFTHTWYCLNPAYTGASHGFYINSGTNYSFHVAAYSGAASSSVLDTSAISTNTNVGTAIQPGSVTPTCTNELVWFGYASEAGTWTSLAGIADVYHHVQDGTGWKGYGVGAVVQTTAVAINPTLTVSSASNSATIVAFKAAISACTGSARRRVTTVTGGE